MTCGVAIARDRVFLFVRGGHTVPPMTATISFPVFRRTHRRTLSDLLEDGELCAAVSLYDGRTIANPFVRTRELVDALRQLAR
jgi:hypothetical protein